ncbi:MAG: protein tyrosine phosphatase, partial [Actinobacteria bacterium]
NPKVVQTEQEVADAAGFGYFHLTVPDHYRPQNEQVDRFVAFVRDLPPNTWLHFHCRAGVGRTTTFMAMYDMLRDAKTLSMNDILRRQVAVGGKDLLGGDVSGNDNKTERVQFLRQFYDYAQTNLDGFQTPFTAWLAAGGR